jgi:hypothetical protein
MPIPSKKPEENNKDFIQRCMIDPVMLEEYPDIHQRFAICNDQIFKK